MSSKMRREWPKQDLALIITTKTQLSSVSVAVAKKADSVLQSHPRQPSTSTHGTIGAKIMHLSSEACKHRLPIGNVVMPPSAISMSCRSSQLEWTKTGRDGSRSLSQQPGHALDDSLTHAFVLVTPAESLSYPVAR